jgi:hypothetical protein
VGTDDVLVDVTRKFTMMDLNVASTFRIHIFLSNDFRCVGRFQYQDIPPSPEYLALHPRNS